MRPLLTVGRRVRLRHVRAAIDAAVHPGARVLDAGCADGRLAIGVARDHPDCTVLGIDPDAAELERAAASSHGVPNVEFRRLSIGDDLSEQFDVVVCTDGLEHIDDDGAAVRWLAEHVRPGGRLLVHVPARDQVHRIRSVRAAMEAELAGGHGPHVREGYEPADLARLAESAELAVDETRFTFHVPVTRLAADVDTWTFIHRRRELKALLLPLLLPGAAVERSPSTRRGNGVLLSATRPVSG